MQDLARKRLVIFTGKGGVGKTTCSAAAALHFAKKGRKTLLVTVDPAKRLEDALGVPVGDTETAVAENLVAMMLDPGTVIREHLAREVPRWSAENHCYSCHHNGDAARALYAAARAGRSALLVAPTGAGKTLAGFLPSLAELIEAPTEGLHTLYISPLKA
ncbi:MAG: ArsA-related P-loop ATPase, partial [Thermoplasmatota archaeon]